MSDYEEIYPALSVAGLVLFGAEDDNSIGSVLNLSSPRVGGSLQIGDPLAQSAYVLYADQIAGDGFPSAVTLTEQYIYQYFAEFTDSTSYDSFFGSALGDGSFLIGARFDDTGGTNAGAAYVVFGDPAPGTSLDVSTLDGTNGFKIVGAADQDQLGFAVAGAGDINGDGFNDWIVGTNSADNAGYASGSAYVVFGQAAPFDPVLDVSTLNGANGFRIDGAAIGDGLGVSVASAGDFNGDGFDDVVVGAPGAGFGGEAHVIFGSDQPFDPVLSVSSLDGSNGVKLTGPGNGSRTGITVATGDINADGFTDVIAGAPGAKDIYVFFGTADGVAEIDGNDFDGTNGFTLVGGDIRFGYSLAIADVNGDGFDDIVAGDDLAGYDINGVSYGRVYVVFGAAVGPATPLDVTTLDGDNGVVIGGVNPYDYAGRAIAAGDVDGDGFAEVFLGAPGYDHVDGADTVEDAGAIYMVNIFDDILEPVNRVGTAIGNVIQGSGFGDTLTGLGGNDELNGRAGDDRLEGGAGADQLNGGAGGDLMIGGTGNDTYVLNGADTVTETANGGTDTARVTASFTLLPTLENLILGGTGDIDGTGNGAHNRLTGNGGANELAGANGNDTVIAGNGNDTASGGNGDDLLNGGDGNDRLSGNAGSDTLLGGTGKEVLLGGADGDTFRFTAISHLGLGATRDLIADFSAAADFIDVTAIDAATGTVGVQDFDYIGADVAFTGEGQVRAIQSGANAVLQFNRTGSNGAELELMLKNVLASDLTDGNFLT